MKKLLFKLIGAVLLKALSKRFGSSRGYGSYYRGGYTPSYGAYKPYKKKSLWKRLKDLVD